ncbi:MAG: hypothetical protein C0467_21650 [Planctomycetaceae bacterium]|nr:hypothetical protein [Planctomycetaceae bacterium]
MSNAGFGWEALLGTDAPPGCSLKAGLFTTYDRADNRLVAEHLLPLLLKLGREPAAEGVERQYFLLELDRRLKQLHDCLVIISSTSREEPADAEGPEGDTYAWIWRSIRHLTVGSRGKAVQHAKLWLLHWVGEEDLEYLEVVVSSANLNLAAFRGQLQAVWRVCIELRPQRSTPRLSRWGVLPDFLRELATSAGEETRLDQFVELLARADCPDGVRIVASVPGKHSRQALRRTPWGSAGLGEITPSGRGRVSVAILSPFVGSWNMDDLARWCAHFEGAPDRLTLVWIDENHPWARAQRWVLPASTLRALIDRDVTLLQLRHDADDADATDRFHDEHRGADTRWSHAKVYSFRRGTSRRVLVTSANFSPAAWGRENESGELNIENFELGVCVEQAVWPFEDLEPFRSAQDAATVAELPDRNTAFITWAQAVWKDGMVRVKCRCEAKRDLEGKINGGGVWTPINHWVVDAADRLRSAEVPWAEAIRPPVSVLLTCEQETVIVAVFDERPPTEREETLPPEVDEDVARSMRDELLFEQYGGRVAMGAEVVSATDSGVLLDEEDDGDDSGRPESYSVPAFVLARWHLNVVDNWAERVKLAGTRSANVYERQILRRDGELLFEAFKRQTIRDGKTEPAGAIGAKLAAEELAVRLKHFWE